MALLLCFLSFKNQMIMIAISKMFCETKLRQSYNFNLQSALEWVPEMGGTTHMAWLVEGPAGPSTVWVGNGEGLKGIFHHLTQEQRGELGWLWLQQNSTRQSA